MQEIDHSWVKRNATNKNKRKGLVTAGDVNIGNIQHSTIQVQMIGCKRVHSGTRKHSKHTYSISTNLIGAHYNVSASHPSMFVIQFPKVPPRRESGNDNVLGLSCHQCTWMNQEIGAPYNGLASYPSKFQIQFPKIPKKRRTQNRKSLNTRITSFVITKNGAPLLISSRR
ncbi:hypothetical protein MtrunA17_Chr6g0485751 [Medicago truncatula]|uniref:Uncharacterized protein n=1 Tax=Medicago truncatula TaxID=3880 RepID=G7KPW3_MEDTR|nr:hypothetical protein MTR_6g088530 [Medicago truncatula]RHN52915.1 hypothetical protein MtrunA17_Chr6g0485751 [Medicago truncatula]